MKGKKVLYVILMFLPLAVSLGSLLFLPDQIPAHYGWDGLVTRWGSKYETLIFPCVTILFGLLMAGITKWVGKQEKEGENNAKVCLLAGLACLVLYNAMTFYFLYLDFTATTDLGAVPGDLNGIIFGILGAGLILIGNVMPKLRMNSAIGLRTRWSMKNEVVWKKCQRFGGIAAMITGAAMIAAAVFLKGTACTAVCMGALAVMALADLIYSRQAAKE